MKHLHSAYEAAALLRDSELVAIPTETVYGLAADATNAEAVAKIYEAKQRPQFNPLIAHFASQEAAEREVEFTPLARKLAAAFWPGPLTLVLRATPDTRICALARAGLPTQAVRVPAHPLAQKLLREVAVPLVAPSANASGTLSPVSSAHVAKSLAGKIGWILEGGECSEGLESTIVDATGEQPVLLRAGTITATQIAEAAGYEVRLQLHAGEGEVKSPGQLLRHYAPRGGLRIGTQNPQSGEALLAFGAEIPPGFTHVLNLSERSDLREAAANLFSMLHQLEAYPIATMPVPEEGLGLAINDRLRRASSSL